MVNNCCVPLCKSTEKLGIILHRIPKDEKRQKLFAEAIKKHKWNPKNARICEVRPELFQLDRFNLLDFGLPRLRLFYLFQMKKPVRKYWALL